MVLTSEVLFISKKGKVGIGEIQDKFSLKEIAYTITTFLVKFGFAE